MTPVIIKKIQAFSLAEALMALLIVALIITAMIPVLTKKYRTIGNHGRWECTMNKDGQHVVRMVVGGKDTGFKLSGTGASCTFTPPANAENFSVKVIGGGGSGAGGQAGNGAETQIVATDSIRTLNAPFDGDFSITLQGGGGAGGGMSCGFAKDKVFKDSMLEPQFADYGTTGDGSGGLCATCTAKDVRASGFDYKRLFKNEEAAYRPYANTDKILCFAESGWTNAATDDDKCWNFPGHGGGASTSANHTVKLNKGDLITLSPSEGGRSGEKGGAGGNGDQACFSAPNGKKECQSGGAGGVNRYLMDVSYNNIPVDYVVTESYKLCDEYNQVQCPDVCDAEGNCVPSTEMCNGDTCLAWGTYYREFSRKRKTRNNYFSIPACVNNGAMLGQNADEPALVNTTNENGDTIGGAGSGGRGAGRILIEDMIKSQPELAIYGSNLYSGQSGSTGFAALRYVTYSGGSGGQAGSYVYSLYKKLPVVKNITIGSGGSTVGVNNDGQNGLTTQFGDLLKAHGGAGGRAMSNYPDISKGETTASGGNGTPSPLDGGLFKGFIVAYGGYTEHNDNINGYSVSTYVWNVLSALSVGGKLTQYTYGAGGGGGGGKNGGAGTGGAGAPGAVIIEW